MTIYWPFYLLDSAPSRWTFLMSTFDWLAFRTEQRCQGLKLHIKKGWGCLSEILRRTPKRYQDPALWAWLAIFSPLGGTNKTTPYLIIHYYMFLWLNSLKGTTKAPAADLLRLNTLRGNKTALLTPKGYHKHYVLFIWYGIPFIFLQVVCFLWTILALAHASLVWPKNIGSRY